MPRVTIELLDARDRHVDDPRVLVRFVHVASGQAITTDLELAGSPRRVDAPLVPGGYYRVEMAPTRYSPVVRALSAVDDDLTVSATVLHRPSEWVPAFTPWASLTAGFEPLQRVLETSDRLRVGRVTGPVRFVGAEYDAVTPEDESRMLAKTSLLNMYALLVTEPRPGTTGGTWFDGLREILLATRERIVAIIEEADASLIERIAKRGAHAVRYKRAPATLHAKNFAEIDGFEFDRQKLFSVKTRDRYGSLQLTVARGRRAGKPLVLLDADCDENGRAFAHALDLPKHAVTGGTNPIEIHDILVRRDRARDLGYDLVTRLSEEALLAARVQARLLDVRELARTVPKSVRQIAVLGDSVAWGQGLTEDQKLHRLVAEALANGVSPQSHQLAHSGAVIGVGIVPAPVPPVHGEVPRSRPTILEQAGALPRPASLDLVILNGGINDLDVRYILNPVTSIQELTDDVMRVCDVELGVLLEHVSARVTKPSARIVVLSYYPILSEDSRFARLDPFLDALGIARPLAQEPAGLRFAFWSRVLENCAVFYDVSLRAMRSAIERVNAGGGGGRIRLAAPPFRPENAALASRPWLFGLSPILGPQDPVRGERRAACNLAEPDVFRRFQCHRASAGHPNELGAAEFAAAVLGSLS